MSTSKNQTFHGSFDTGFVRDNPNLTNMINRNRLDEYSLYFLVYGIIKILNNLNNR